MHPHFPFAKATTLGYDKPLRTLLDSGAHDNFISVSALRKLQQSHASHYIKLRSCAENPPLISGIAGQFEAKQVVELYIALHPTVHGKIKCFIMPTMEDGVDLLLGRPALGKFRVKMSFDEEDMKATASARNLKERVQLQPFGSEELDQHLGQGKGLFDHQSKN